MCTIWFTQYRAGHSTGSAFLPNATDAGGIQTSQCPEASSFPTPSVNFPDGGPRNGSPDATESYHCMALIAHIHSTLSTTQELGKAHSIHRLTYTPWRQDTER